MKSTIYLRAHTERKEKPKRENRKKTEKKLVPKWPEVALVFDTETTADDRQSLTFGIYRLLRNVRGSYSEVREEGIFFSDDTSPSDRRMLIRYADHHSSETAPDCPRRICIRPLSEFIDTVFLPNALAGSMVVGFNLPFDISRIAFDARKARRLNEDWSFVMSRDIDPVSEEPRDNPFAPRIKITRKDGKFAFIKLAGVSMCDPNTGKRFKPYRPGRFLDLRTLGWALRNISYSLETACKEFKVPGKLDHTPSGIVSLEEIDYCRQDVRSTVNLLNALRADFDCHPIDLKPERAYSPASIAKAYLRGMGLVPPSRKFRFSPKIQGIAAQAYFGGRAEARIRHTVVPVVSTDFKSEYPTVNTLMGLWPLLTAEQVKIKPATNQIRQLIENVSLAATFESKFWKDLVGYALVVPDGDIFPVRTRYNGESNNVGVNPLTSKEPIWFALPDVVAAKLLSGKSPKILKAFFVVHKGQQADLRPIALRGHTLVDPRTDDFFKTVIEARERIKNDGTLPEAEREAQQYFLKILANAGSYGLFIETTPKRVPERERIEVMSGESGFSTSSDIVEDKGSWYCPVISSLITAGGRLLLAMLERSVTDAGGSYLFCDTDSMSIVAKRDRGLLPCEGGPHRLADGGDAVKALSWDGVCEIVLRFDNLNPYDFQGSILKVEKKSLERELFGLAVSTKRYCLFTRREGGIQIESASSHGLGYLFVPKTGFDKRANAAVWVVAAWEYIAKSFLGLPATQPTWFSLPAMMKVGITTPEVLKVLQSRQENLSYSKRSKPFNFFITPQINRMGLTGYPLDVDTEYFTLIAPFTDDSSRWFKLEWINVHDGKVYRLAPIGQKTSTHAAPGLLEDVILMHQVHVESKSLAPNGMPCEWHTRGLLRRTPVTAWGVPQFIGKETDRKWEQEDDISMLFPLLPVYRPNETENLVADSELNQKVQARSVRKLAKSASVNPATIQAIRDGHRVQKNTVRKVSNALLRMQDAEDEDEMAGQKVS